jgi:hypothetical protein
MNPQKEFERFAHGEVVLQRVAVADEHDRAARVWHLAALRLGEKNLSALGFRNARHEPKQTCFPTAILPAHPDDLASSHIEVEFGEQFPHASAAFEVAHRQSHGVEGISGVDLQGID